MSAYTWMAAALTLAVVVPAHSLTLDEFIEVAKQRCSAYGYATGSDGNARCVQEMVEKAQSVSANKESARRRCAGEWSDVNGSFDPSASDRCRANPDRYFAEKAARQRAAEGITCTRMLNTVNCF